MIPNTTKYNAAMTVAGIALVAGFFLPWISFGGFDGISGWNIAWQSQGDYLSRLALLCVPFLGVALAMAGVTRSRKAASLSVLIGVGILGYTFVKLAWNILGTTGFGIWMVLGGAAAALVLGLRAQQRVGNK